MTTSPKEVSSETVESIIDKAYGIKPIKPPTFIGEGVENAAWIFDTDQENYVLKIFSQSDTIKKDVEEEVLLYEFLLRNNLHVPEVIPTLDGKNTSTITGTFPAILMALEELKRIPASDLSRDQADKIAITVSHMHRILLDYPRVEYVRTSTHNAISIYNHSINDFEIFLASPNASSPYLLDHARLKNIRMNTIDFLKQQKLDENLTKAVIHSDLGLGHLQFLPNGEIYVFDFSDFEYGPVALDLGVLFFNFYREGELSVDEWKSMTGSFMTTYEKELVLTENDKRAINLFSMSRMLEHIRYLDKMSIKEGHSMDAEGIRKRYDLLEELYLKKVE